MATLRDYQRKKLYDAEDAAFNNKGLHWKEEKLCKESSLDFAKKIVNTEYWKQQKGWNKVKLTFRGGNGTNASYYPAEKSVNLPPWARNELVIIHEFSHYLTHKTQKDYVGHGSHFAGHYLALVDELLGVEYSGLLLEEFEKQGVRYHLM